MSFTFFAEAVRRASTGQKACCTTFSALRPSVCSVVAWRHAPARNISQLMATRAPSGSELMSSTCTRVHKPQWRVVKEQREPPPWSVLDSAMFSATASATASLSDANRSKASGSVQAASSSAASSLHKGTAPSEAAFADSQACLVQFALSCR
eukprot:CAMPEP_0179425908 /NCGR_PEP_ID=MMETSP0799-20121207/12437_1 /TAXON_ID=46947 /ORGANISM="Geminigera cryophila, Strain CCMP2564" /LENGTH=151 /DNA_ID=CAMNT_0021200587 /DNA_START=37 /DNA_END=492 /DNA_ORIENTATION=+